MSAKVQRALEDVLLHDAALREKLVGVYGFTVQEVRQHTILSSLIACDLHNLPYIFTVCSSMLLACVAACMTTHRVLVGPNVA